MHPDGFGMPHVGHDRNPCAYADKQPDDLFPPSASAAETIAAAGGVERIDDLVSGRATDEQYEG